MNLSAFREVRGVNADVLEELRRGGFNEKENTSTFCPEYKSQSASNYQLRTPAPQEDNEMLRGMLNQEMKKNSALLLQMSRLDEENRVLKEQGYGGYDARGLQAENQKLRRALSQVSNLPQEIFSELEELKRENQNLRKDTVKLLRKTERFV